MQFTMFGAILILHDGATCELPGQGTPTMELRESFA